MMRFDIKKFEKTPEDIEQFLLRVCNDEFIDIQFDYPYEPEIKLKMIYEELKTAAHHSITDAESLKGLDKLFISAVHSALKKIPAVNSNFNTIHRLLLLIDLIKPVDSNKIIKAILEQSKFIHLTAEFNNYNLHIELLNVYLGLISENEEISFVENYLNSEVQQNRLFQFPNFIAIFLRFYIKFRRTDYFLALETLIPFIDNEDKSFRIIISLNEYIKAQRSYRDLLTWLVNDFEALYQKNKTNTARLVLYTIADWIKKKRNADKNKYLLLISAELVIINDEEDITGIYPHLKEFCASDWSNKLELKSVKNDFFEFIKKLKQSKFHIEYLIEPGGNDYFVVYMQPRRDLTNRKKADELFNATDYIYLLVPNSFMAEFEKVIDS